jgi:hypothetical protein
MHKKDQGILKATTGKNSTLEAYPDRNPFKIIGGRGGI